MVAASPKVRAQARTSRSEDAQVGGRLGGAVRGARAVGRLLGEAGRVAQRQVAVDLVGAVRGARAVGRLLGEAGRVAQRQVAVDLVGGDVVVAHAVLAAGLDEGVGAAHVGLEERRRVGDGVVVVGLRGVVDHGVDVVVAHAVLAAGLDEGVGAAHVGLEERRRVGDGVVVVGLRGVVDHGVGLGDQAVDQLGVADVAHDELDSVRGEPRDVLGVACVGQLVEHGDVDARVLARDVVDEVGADEAAAAGDDDALGLEGGVGHGILPVRAHATDMIITPARRIITGRPASL